MLNVLLAATPLDGHVGPLVGIGRGFVEGGHRATLVTGSDYRRAAEGNGMTLRALPADADFRERPQKPQRRQRVQRGREQILETFVHPLTAQQRLLSELLHQGDWDAFVCDTAFLGALPLLLTCPPARRIPFVGVSVTPLALPSIDCAPFGSALQPGTSRWSRLRNRQIQWLLTHGPLHPLHDELSGVLADYGVAPHSVDYFDVAGLFDLTFHLAPPEFEYPRRDLPPTMRFVGPLDPQPLPGRLPRWWGDLDAPIPIVHVTQGTMDNADPTKLIVPTIRALADEAVITVVSTGGPAAVDLEKAFGGPLPDNARVARFLPYDQLLPRCDVVVSNGGFGGVLQSLRFGVPLVLAGNTEDKPEVAARVRRLGAGLDLRTGRPSPQQLRAAVRTVLTDRAFRVAALRMSESISRLGDPRVTIVRAVEACSLGLGSTDLHRSSAALAGVRGGELPGPVDAELFHGPSCG